MKRAFSKTSPSPSCYELIHFEGTVHTFGTAVLFFLLTPRKGNSALKICLFPNVEPLILAIKKKLILKFKFKLKSCAG